MNDYFIILYFNKEFAVQFLSLSLSPKETEATSWENKQT